MQEFNEMATLSAKEVADTLKSLAHGNTGYSVSDSELSGAYKFAAELLGISEDALVEYIEAEPGKDAFWNEVEMRLNNLGWTTRPGNVIPGAAEAPYWPDLVISYNGVDYGYVDYTTAEDPEDILAQKKFLNDVVDNLRPMVFMLTNGYVFDIFIDGAYIRTCSNPLSPDTLICTPDNGWDLCGDINPVDYGGTFVKKEPDECGEYEYIRIVVADDGVGNDTRFLFHGLLAYPEDYLDKSYIEEAYRGRGLTSAKELLEKHPAEFADAVFNNFGYGVFEFSPTNIHGRGEYSMEWKDFVASVEEIVKFLKEHNIPEKYWENALD